MNMHEYADRIAADSVRLERLLPGPIERVWAFLTEPDKRGRWLAGGTIELRPGGKVALEFAHEKISHEATPEKYRDMPTSVTGSVTRCEPSRLLAFTWIESHGEHSEVTFELAARGEQVLLTITHRKLHDRETLLGVSAGWDAHVGVLEDVLANRTPRGFWSEHERLEQDYAKRFP
jgi:uncharacterized protein YndB with AHSA1/START domain